MFRLVQLHADDGIPRIGVDPDAYTTEQTALAAFTAAPARFFGVGRFGPDGGLVEIIMDTRCGPVGSCPRTATVVHAETFQRLCGTCAFGLDVLNPTELALWLGITVRTPQVLAASGRHARPDESCAVSNRIAREFAVAVNDAAWRDDVCALLARMPEAVNGLLIGVGALSHRDVLDLYPALCALGAQLPAGVRADLRQASARPLSPAGMTARRLGL